VTALGVCDLLLCQVSSAFGTVGLSFGYPGTVTSLSARFSPTGKVVIMLVMIAGASEVCSANILSSQAGGMRESVHVYGTASRRRLAPWAADVH
jgi:hypothetical protein